jgi:catechol 2,3-dioxygenase-like lactoylglutathione lyase family enzyme
MTPIAAKPRVTSLAPQFLVDDLNRAIAYYRDALGFTFGEPWGGFYAIGRLDGLELHLKEVPKNRRTQAPPRQRAPRRFRRGGGNRSLLRPVRGQRGQDPQAARSDRVGHEGFLRRRPRRLHHLLRRRDDGMKQGLRASTVPAASPRWHVRTAGSRRRLRPVGLLTAHPRCDSF